MNTAIENAKISGFQSTRPSRGETRLCWGGTAERIFQSTRPSRGETNPGGYASCLGLYFNPLAPRGARPFCPISSACNDIFQSTRPSRGETAAVKLLPEIKDISIHSPLAGRDTALSATSPSSPGFQSTRPSRGETWATGRCAVGGKNFNPLAPRGARQRLPPALPHH